MAYACAELFFIGRCLRRKNGTMLRSGEWSKRARVDPLSVHNATPVGVGFVLCVQCKCFCSRVHNMCFVVKSCRTRCESQHPVFQHVPFLFSVGKTKENFTCVDRDAGGDESSWCIAFPSVILL